MTHFSVHSASRIRNRALGVLHLIASDEFCEVPDILALLSQPASQAASTPASAPADVPVEEMPLRSSTENSEGLIPPFLRSQTVDHFALDTDDLDRSRVHLANCIECRARIYEGDNHYVTPNDEFYCSACPNGGATAPVSPETAPSGEAPMVTAAGESPVIPAAEDIGAQPTGGENVDPAESQHAIDDDRPDEDGQRADAVALGSDVEPVAPPRMSKREQVYQCHQAHRDWPAKKVAEHLGLSMGSVRGHGSALSIKFPSQRDYDAAVASLADTAPAKSPKRAAQVVPRIGKVATLQDSVRAVHLQHPTWTPSMVAKELGVHVDSVLPVLTRLRNSAPVLDKPTQQKFAGRQDMLAHYTEVGKRLGRS